MKTIKKIFKWILKAIWWLIRDVIYPIIPVWVAMGFFALGDCLQTDYAFASIVMAVLGWFALFWYGKNYFNLNKNFYKGELEVNVYHDTKNNKVYVATNNLVDKTVGVKINIKEYSDN